MTPDEKWVSAFETGVEFEAEVVADRLKDSGIPAVVMNQREKSIGIAFSDQKLIRVMVPPDREAEAENLLGQQPLSDEELEEAALNANLSRDNDAADDETGEDE